MKILILDDNPDMLLSLKLLLQHAGFEAETVENVEDALRAQRSRPADVLITDIFMPDADGLQSIQAFRAEWPHMRIIAMSGGGTTVRGNYLSVAAQVGADVTLSKPFEPDALLRVLARFCASPSPSGS